MSNLFKNLKPTAQVSKNGFDLSRKVVYSSRNGLIESPLQIETVPNDFIEIDMASLTRTMTMNTAAFLRGKFRYDFFFVPYVQLWHNFNQFITQRDDAHSTLFKGKNFCPVIDLGRLLQLIVTSFYDIAEQNFNTSQPYYVDIHGYYWCINAIRLLDLLGYGNHFFLVKMFEEDYNAVKSGGSVKNHIVCDNYAYKFVGKKVNVFRVCAYQHIWYDYYRNKYYDVKSYLRGLSNERIYTDYLSYFNLDDLECDSDGTCELPFGEDYNERIIGMFTLRYAPWKKDLFTGSLPGQQFGAVSSVVFDGETLSAEYPNDASEIVKSDGSYPSGKQILQNDGGLLGNTTNTSLYAVRTAHTHNLINPSIDVLSLRKAEMLQAWKQATLRAGNMTDDNFQAHYGVSPYYDSDENVNFLGSYEAMLQVNAVEATAATSDTTNGMVGDIGATGTAVARGHKIRFECRDFGVIMCMAYFVPETEYNSTMIDKANRLYEQFDFYTPEFQNLGLEPIQMVDYDAITSTNSLNHQNRVIGYAPRYWMYKTALDKVHGEFSQFPVFNDPTDPTQTWDDGFVGSLVPWVAPRYDTKYLHAPNSNYIYRSIASLYVSPHVYDNVFAITSNSFPNTDTYLNNIYFDVKAIRPMSQLGLPQF